MSINLHNYESYILDYYENNLSTTEVGEVLIFLEEHPHLKKAFEEYENIFLLKEDFFYLEKEKIKKREVEVKESILSDITIQNCEQYFVAFAEGDISPEKIQQLNNFLKNNPLQEDNFRLIKQCKLIPEKIIFEEKSSLKRKIIYEKRQPYIFPLFSTFQRPFYYAASIIIFLSLFFLFKKNEPEKKLIANKSELIEKVITSQKQISPIVTANVLWPPNPIHTKTNFFGNYKRKKSSEKQTNYKKFNPIIIADAPVKEIYISQSERDSLQIMKKEEAELLTISASGIAPKPIVQSNDGYQSVEVFLSNRIRNILGISNTDKSNKSEKLNEWDIVMIAKNGIQKLMGNKIININKTIDGEDIKTEYIFAAGNLEISKSYSK